MPVLMFILLLGVSLGSLLPDLSLSHTTGAVWYLLSSAYHPPPNKGILGRLPVTASVLLITGVGM